MSKITVTSKLLHRPKADVLLEYDELPNDKVTLSDGHHTMDELYEHRNLLFVIALCGMQWFNNCDVGPFRYQIWKSKYHEDGSMYEGWFIAGAYIPGKIESEISYHLPLDLWNILKCPERLHAPIYSGYTSKDVLERLRKYYL